MAAAAGTAILAVVAEILARHRSDPLPAVAEAVRADQDADRVSIATFDTDRFTIVAHAGWGLLARDATLPVSTSTHFTMSAQGRLYLVDDFDDQPEFHRPVDELMLSNGYRSGCSVPLRVGDNLVGALSVSSAHATVPARQRLPGLEGVAALLAVHVASAPTRPRSGIVVCSDRALVGHGVARFLDGEDVHVSVATRLPEALEIVRAATEAPLVLSETYFAGEPVTALMQRIRSVHPSSLLALFGEHDTPEVHSLAAAAGGVFVGDQPDSVPAGVRDLVAGRRRPPPASRASWPLAVDLTRREVDVLLALDRGLAVRQTARELGLSEVTVKGYTRSLFAKLDAHSRSEAVYQARILGLLASASAARDDIARAAHHP